MQKEALEKFKDYMEKGNILKGRVKLVQRDEKYDTDILLLDLDGVKAIIKREDFDIKDNKQSLVPVVGANVKFIIKEIEEDGTLICSRKVVKEYERDLLIEELETGAEVEGKIVHIQKFGAYLKVKGTTVTLRNMDFSIDHTTVSDLHKVGDVIKVKLHRVTSTKKILVEAVEKYCNPTSIDFSTFSPQQVVYGRTIKTWGCYVCIAPNLDALAPVPDDPNYEIEEGMSVLLKITKVDEELQRVRGKILNVIKDEADFTLD